MGGGPRRGARADTSGRAAGRYTFSLQWCLVFLACLFPAWRWVWLGYAGQLGVNPPEFLIRSSGIWSLVALGAVLAVSPMRRWAGWTAPLRYRRMLGLFAFFYATLHVLGWALWEWGFALAPMWQDILQRTFLQVGALAYVPLIWMALTSTRGWRLRLGAWWQRLHYAIYPVAALSLWHFWLMRSGKTDYADVWWAIAAALVLGLARLRRGAK